MLHLPCHCQSEGLADEAGTPGIQAAKAYIEGFHAPAQVGFNLEVGGYFSIKRNVMSINGNTFVRPDQVVAYCKALLEVFRCAYILAALLSLPLVICQGCLPCSLARLHAHQDACHQQLQISAPQLGNRSCKCDKAPTCPGTM